MGNLVFDNTLLSPAAWVRRLVDLLGAGRSVAAATVAARDGGVFKMLVGHDGAIDGGAEGGVLERVVVARAATVLATGTPQWVDFSSPGTFGPGEEACRDDIAWLFLERIDPGLEPGGGHGPGVFGELASRLARGGAGLLLTPIDPADGRQGHRAQRCLLWPGGLAGSAPPEAVLGEVRRRAVALGAPVVIEVADARYLLEPYQPLDPVYIAGAGRIPRHVAPLAVQAGFRVAVLDVDAAFANRQRFPEADEVAVLPSFDDGFADRPVDGNASVVVATRGHAHDRTALAQALRAGAGYVGLMACRADGRAALDALAREGFSREALDRVHTPIGLPIGGKAPGEVALSIVAELVAARSARRKSGSAPAKAPGGADGACP